MRSWGLALAATIVVLGCGGSTSGGAPADGGAGTGGSSGSGGTSGSGGSAGARSQPECTTNDDCTLVDDCCTCRAIAKGEDAPACGGGECFATACAALGVPAASAQCVAGRCVVSVDCDAKRATCKELPSPCPAGQARAVVAGCWGGCIDAGECADVTDCSVCDPATQICVVYEAFTSAYHCAALAPACGADRTCACAGKTVCVGGFGACGPTATDGAVHCACPAC